MLKKILFAVKSNRNYVYLLVAVALFYHLFFFNYGVNLLDDGLLLHGTERLMEGEILYKDVFSLYPPGMYVSLMLFFKLFGHSILTLKIMCLFFLILTVPVVYYLSNSIIKNKGFSLIPPLLIIFCSFKIPYARHFFILLSLLLLIKLYRKPFLLAVPGFMLGIGGLFSHEFAFAALIASFIFIIFSHPYFDFKKCIKKISMFSLGVLIPVVPLLLYFYHNSALSNFFYNLVYYPLMVYPKYHSLPYPSLFAGLPNILLWAFRKGLIFYIPFLVYIISFFYLLFKIIKKRRINKDTNIFILMFIFGLCIFKLSFTRSDLPHLWHALIPVYILSTFFLYKIYKKLNIRKFLAILLVLIIPFLFILQWPVYQIINHPNAENIFIWLPKAQIYEKETKSKEIIGVVEYIQNNTKKNEYILVIPYETIFYFLTESKDITSHMAFLPGYPDEEVQKRLIKKIKDNEIKYVVYGHGWDVDGKSFKNYARIIDEYVADNYYLEKKIYSYDILRKK